MNKYIFFLLLSFTARSQDTLDLSSSKVGWDIHSCTIDTNSTFILMSILDNLTISSDKKITLYFEEAYTNESEQVFVKCRGESLKSYIETWSSIIVVELKTNAEFVNSETMRKMIFNGTRRKIYLLIE